MLGIFSYLDYCMLGALALVMLHQGYFYLRYMTVVNRRNRQSPNKEYCYPKVSVIVCARNEQENVQTYLHALLHQDYPCYEVIVVNDRSEDGTQLVLEQYAQQYSNLHLTFVPREARVVSSKKLALTIGVKAAHYDYILLTDADCRPESIYWIREMMQGFANEQTEVVLGYGAYFEKKSLLSALISYDTLFIGLQYLGMAAAGHPYMGVGRNLAYKKETFFRNNGFRGLLSERAGDDDLFVNKVATTTNTSVVCSPESITWSPTKTTWREWLHQKRRHLSVAPHYKAGSKIRLGIEPMTRGLLYALLIAIAVFGNGWAMMIAYGLWWLRLVMQICVINTSAYRLGGRLFGIEIVAYDILLPLITIWLLLAQRLRKRPIYW
ncbi:MAG: glycosyltransferase [Paludibacteraceae bacterium]|nr:glycosyltransferase [Paludibacteraceae bacterium]